MAKRVSEIFWSKTCSGVKRKFGQQRNSILPLQQYQRTTTAGLQLLYSACTTETSNPKMLRWCFGASMRTGPCPYQKFHYCIWNIFSITINVAIIFVQVLNFDSLHLGVYHSWCKISEKPYRLWKARKLTPSGEHAFLAYSLRCNSALF